MANATVQYIDRQNHPDDRGRGGQRLDNNLRARVLKALVMMHMKVARLAEYPLNVFTNIPETCKITAIVNTVIQANRQSSRNVGAAFALACAARVYPLNNRNLQYAALNAEWATCKVVCGLDAIEHGQLYGTLCPILSYITLFKHRVAEIRMGRDSIGVGTVRAEVAGAGEGMAQEEVVERRIKISHYGLQAMHQPFLEGVSYPPMIKSATAQSLGPLTSAIMVKNTRTEQYRGKWKAAMIRQIQHIKGARDIVNQYDAANPQEANQMLGLIANILTLTGSRQIHRLTPPFSLFLHMAFSSNDIKALWEGKVVYPDPLAITAAQAEINNIPASTPKQERDQMIQRITDQIPNIEVNPLEMDFSSRKAFVAWNRASNATHYLSWDIGEQSANLVLQASWGTAFEDQAFVHWLLEEGQRAFASRKQLDTAFRGMGGRQPVPIEVPRFRYYCKLNSANPTKLMPSGSQQCCCDTVFAGKRKMRANTDLLNTLKATGEQRVTAATVQEAIGNLQDTLRMLLQKLDKDPVHEIGTVDIKSLENDADVHYTVTTQRYFHRSEED